MRGLARALRGLWWRRGSSLALLVVAAACVLVATVGPLYAATEGRALVREGLTAAGADRTAVQASVDATADPRAAQALAARLPPPGATPGLPDRITGLEFSSGSYQPLAGAGRSAVALVSARSGSCSHIVLRSGRCPRATGEVMVGAQTAAGVGWRVGTVLGQQQGYAQTPLTVVGTYRPRDAADSWWAGLPISATVGAGLAEVQPILTADATLDHPWSVGPLRHDGRTVAASTTFVPASGATCRELRLTLGHCPDAANEAVVSVRTAARLQVAIGSSIAVPVTPSGTAIRIVGLYRPSDPQDDFWREPGYLSDAADLVVIDQSTWSEAAHTVTGTVTMPLRPSEVDGVSTDRLRRSATTLVAAVDRVAGNSAGQTSLPSVLAGIDDNLSGLRSLTAIVLVQILLLAWFVLYLVVAGASEARAGELALARLRGLRTGQTLRFGLAEPTVLVLLALPTGYVLALPVTAALTGRAPVPDLLSVGAALVAVAGAVVAVGLAARRVLTRPVLEQWRRSGGDRAGTRALSPADGVILALALVGLVELRTGSSLASGDSGVTLLGPALVALGIAVVGVRLLPLLCRVLIGTSRAASGVGLFLAARQVARRPAGLRLVALFAVAVSLVWFAAAASGVAASNRQQRARSEIGAAEVLTVSPRQDLVQAVRRADPSGRYAMAAAVVPAGSGQPGLLAVDSTRLAAVAYWLAVDGTTPAALARRLQPADGQARPGRSLVVVPTSRTDAAFAADGQSDDEATGLDGRSVPATSSGTVTRLPVLGTRGQLADLSTAEALVTAPQQVTGASRAEVWLAPGTPATVRTALRRQGVVVLGAATTRARIAQLSRQGPALGLRLFLTGALAAAVLAAAATALSTYLSARQRTYELATLSLLAYPRRTLLSAAIGEQALLLASGLVLGVLGGLAGTALSLSALPFYADRNPLPLDLAPPYARLGLVMIALAVLVAAIGAGSSLLLVRAARTTRLREVP